MIIADFIMMHIPSMKQLNDQSRVVYNFFPGWSYLSYPPSRHSSFFILTTCICSVQLLVPPQLFLPNRVNSSQAIQTGNSHPPLWHYHPASASLLLHPGFLPLPCGVFLSLLPREGFLDTRHTKPRRVVWRQTNGFALRLGKPRSRKSHFYSSSRLALPDVNSPPPTPYLTYTRPTS